MMLMAVLADILPPVPSGTPGQLAQGAIDFFSTWIERVGGVIAIVGAIKFALSIQSDDPKEQIQAVLILVSGFMIQSAIGAGLFDVPATYTEAAATAEFYSILRFIGKWIRHVGAFGMFIGGISFAFAIKDNNAVTKIIGIKTMAAGAMAMALSATSVLMEFM